MLVVRNKFLKLQTIIIIIGRCKHFKHIRQVEECCRLRSADAKCMKFVNITVEHSVATLMTGGKFIVFILICIIACRVNNCTGWDKNKKTTVL